MTRKKFFSVIIFCTVFFMAVSTSADVQKFRHFSVDVPSGWTAYEQGSTLIIKSQKTDASVAVAFNSMGEASLSDIVERLYLQMDGTDLEQDEDGDYMFNFTNTAGVDSVALAITGFDDEKVEGDLQKILDSIDWED